MLPLKQINMQKVTCNRVGHQQKFIEILCLNSDCKETATLCSKCLVNTHLQCRNQVQDIEEIPKCLMDLQKLSLDILILQENVNQQFKELLGLIQQILGPITKYQEQPNFTNLNEIAILLKQVPMQNININQSIERTKSQIRLLLDNHNCKSQNNKLEQKQQVQEQEQVQDQEQEQVNEKEQKIEYEQKQKQKIQQEKEQVHEQEQEQVHEQEQEQVHEQEQEQLQVQQQKQEYEARLNDYIWNSKGKALHDQQKYSDAIDCYNKAIELDPYDFFSYYKKGDALHDSKKYREAIDCYNKAIELNPNYFWIWYEKGQALVQIGSLEDAIKCFEKATQLKPDELLVRKSLERARFKLRKKQCFVM